MWQRKLRTNKIFQILKNIFLIILGTALLFLTVYFAVSNFLLSKTPFVSPLSKTSDESFEKKLSKANIPFTSVSVASDSSFLIVLKDGSEVNLSDKKNIQKQISSLQLILSRLTIEGKRFKRLDLRFDKPIIVF